MTMDSITVVGVGRLGLCAALCFEKAGYNVLGIDLSPAYVGALNDKTFVSNEPSVMEMLHSSKNFIASTSIEDGIAHSDVLYILVDTPSTGGNRHYDVSKLGNVLSSLNKYKLRNKHVIIGCTVLPGYVDTIGNYLLRDCENTSLSYNPEFIQQGDIVRGFLNPDMVLIGEGSKKAGDFIESVYKKVCHTTPVISRMSPSSAEITKLSINCFITTKISFANMVGDIADATPGANKFDILAAVGADSRVGRKCLMPGYGFGGPCFPRDNRALGGYAESIGVEPMIPVATDSYNRYHTEKQACQKIAENKSKYVFEDVAYKPGCPVPIIEESQKLAVAYKVAKSGKKVTLVDRDFIIDAVQKEYGKVFEYSVVKSTK